MINRRHFVASGATGAAFLGTANAAMAATRGLVGSSPADQFAREIFRALTPEQQDMALARVAQVGWNETGLPTLRSLQAAIAADFRAGASHKVRGIRFSETEIAWCVARIRERGLA